MCAQLGVVHGRFQPLHLGHLEYILAAAQRSEILLVGITNPDPSQVAHETADPGRSAVAANPCTFYERYLMVEAALTASGVARERFRIVPFPHSFPERLRYYVPPGARHFLTVYDAWGETKLERFRRLGWDVEVLWRRSEKVVSGAGLRRLIRAGLPWEHLVAPGVAAVMAEHDVATRIAREERAGHRTGEAVPR